MTNQDLPSTGGKYDEIGTLGLNTLSGYIQEAYTTELTWPSCEPTYRRIFRADPEVAITRMLFTAWGGQLGVKVEIPEMEDVEETDDDKRAQKFAQSVLDEMDNGGIRQMLTDALVKVPFYGWGWWETPPAVRSSTWKPPQDDPWRSKSDDGLLGFRRFAFRRYSSWFNWQLDDSTGRLSGMTQLDYPNARVLIPLDRSVHLTFGDSDNPEGLATMEALYRLEGIKRAYETIMGIGFEHAAGHLKVNSTEKLDTDDKTNIRAMARAIMSAQPGNFMAFPAHMDGNLVDVPFAAGASLLEVIRYYSILKLALLGMQWVALSGLSGVGSYASMQDSSQMAVMLFNSMAEDFVRQIDTQLLGRLFAFPVNKAAFPNMTRRPVLKLTPIDKDVPLNELAQLATALSAVMPLDDNDYIAIRRKTGFLPESMPDTNKPDMPDQATQDKLPQDVPGQVQNKLGSSKATAENLDTSAGLNGAQITAVLEVLTRMKAGDITDVVAVELLVSVGVTRERAQLIVNEIKNKVTDIPAPVVPQSNGNLSEFTQNETVTLEDKIKTLPEYLQNEINRTAKEFAGLREASRRDGAAYLDKLSDAEWNKAVEDSLQEGE